MVSVERQKAAKRAERAETFQIVGQIVTALGSFAVYMVSNDLIVGSLLFAGGYPLHERAKSNKERAALFRNSELADDDPRLPSLRRNYFKEAVAGAKAVAEVPGRVVNHFRRAK